LSVLFFQEHGLWVAQALERDIAAFGRSIEEAKKAFEQTVSGYVQVGLKQGKAPLSSLGPAPNVFWEIWNRLVQPHPDTERMPSIPSVPAFMIPVVSHDPLPA
jgi:hypothetical protein